MKYRCVFFVFIFSCIFSTAFSQLRLAEPKLSIDDLLPMRDEIFQGKIRSVITYDVDFSTDSLTGQIKRMSRRHPFKVTFRKDGQALSAERYEDLIIFNYDSVGRFTSRYNTKENRITDSVIYKDTAGLVTKFHNTRKNVFRIDHYFNSWNALEKRKIYDPKGRLVHSALYRYNSEHQLDGWTISNSYFGINVVDELKLPFDTRKIPRGEWATDTVDIVYKKSGTTNIAEYYRKLDNGNRYLLLRHEISDTINSVMGYNQTGKLIEEATLVLHPDRKFYRWRNSLFPEGGTQEFDLFNRRLSSEFRSDPLRHVYEYDAKGNWIKETWIEIRRGKETVTRITERDIEYYNE